MRGRWDDLQREMISVSVRPAFDALHFDDRDNLWIRRYDRSQSGVSQWLIVSATGDLRGNPLLPAGCELRQVRTNRVLCMELDADDLPRLAVYSMK